MEDQNSTSAPEQVSSEAQESQPEPENTNPEPSPDRLINLPSLLSDEFGVAAQTIRLEIMLGTLKIDGEPYEGDKLNIRHEEIAGKEITVEGETRTFQMTYREDAPPLVGEQRTDRRGY